MPKKHDLHVSKHGSNWKVTQDGERLSTHQTQRNAIDRAVERAKRDGTDVVTHGRNGQIDRGFSTAVIRTRQETPKTSDHSGSPTMKELLDRLSHYNLFNYLTARCAVRRVG